MPDFKKARQQQRQYRTQQAVELEPLPETATLPTTEPETLTETQSSTFPSTDTATEASTLPATETATYTSTQDEETQHRKRGKEAFEQTHTRVTYWMDKRLKKQFERCAKANNQAYSTLLEEAVKDVLKKYEA